MSLKMQTCGLRPQFHLMHMEEMGVQTIARGGRSSMQLQHKRPRAGGQQMEGSRARADSWCPQQRGAPSRKHKMPSTCAVHKPEVSRSRVKGYSGTCEGGKSNTVLGYLRNPCFLPVQAYLRFPFPRDQAFNLYSSQYLHALIIILSAQLGCTLFQGSVGSICEKCIYWREDSLSSRILKYENTPEQNHRVSNLSYLDSGNKLVQIQLTKLLLENNPFYSAYYKI